MLELTSTPKFTLVDRSLNNIPSIAITFPDGYEDTLVLDTFESNSGDENRIIGSSQSLSAHIASVNSKRARIQLWTFDYVQLLNKPYENKVTLRRQNPPLKCC